MTYHVHSAQALDAHLSDDTSTQWHDLHQEMKDAYAKDYPQLRLAIRGGSQYALPHRLTYYASNFSSVTPLSEAVVPGFYDSPDTGINTVTTPHLFTWRCDAAHARHHSGRPSSPPPTLRVKARIGYRGGDRWTAMAASAKLKHAHVLHGW